MDSTSEKRDQALRIVGDAGAILSSQAINEVCINLLRKASYSETEIQQTITNFQAKYLIVSVTADVILHASELRSKYSFSYWDRLIVSSALAANCPILYSEDMQNGQRVETLTITNPFVIRP